MERLFTVSPAVHIWKHMLLEFDKQFSDLNLKNVVFFSEVSTILKNLDGCFKGGLRF